MTRREELQEAYEDALFALLMEDVIESEGKRLLEKNEQLRQDPSAAVPEEVDQRCLKTIQKYSGKVNRRETGRKVGRVTYNVFSKAAMVVVICMLLFTAALAASPTLREKTLNLLIEISDINATLIIGDSDNPQVNYDTSDAAMAVYEQFGYRIPEMPEGFALTDELLGSNSAILWYDNPDGASINLSFAKTSGGQYQTDIENSQRVIYVVVNDFDGMLIEKNGRIQISWADVDRNMFISVSGIGISDTALLDIANAIAP